MKKYLSKILISALMVAIFLAPFSAGLKKNNLEAQAKTTIKSLTIDQSKTTENSATFNVTLENVTKNYINDEGYLKKFIEGINYKIYDKSFDIDNPPPVDAVGGTTVLQNGTVSIQTGTLDQPIAEQVVSFSVGNLTPNTNYFLVVKIIKGKTNEGPGGGAEDITTAGIGFTAGSSDTTPTEEAQITNPELGYEIVCGVSNPLGCVALVLYGIWQASAWFARLGGHFLDFFVYYSTNSSSYNNQFISSAWAGVRDIANMFFIFALVYVGLRTILNIHASDNKKIVGKIILVVLVLNFSLFATKIVIDTSNILAKVFYNNITSVDENGKPIQNPGGQKSISVGLVQKFNPQAIITTPEDQLANKGTFIFIIILALAITLYTGYIFFSVALLFVSRVVSLWLSMIMSPIALASMALPFHLPGPIDKDHWLSDLLKNAFLAPLFIFFLYIIVLFTGFLKDIPSIYEGGKADITQHIMGVIIPFMIIVGLLQQAKKIATEYAGDMGARITDWGSKIAGLTLGAGAGAAGLALSGTIGKLASRYLGGAVGAGGTRGEQLKQQSLRGGLAGTIAKAKLRTLNYGEKASFDVRQSPLKGLLGKTGLDLEKGTGAFGVDTKTTAGGYGAIVKRKSEKIEKDFELFKTKMSDDEVKAWSKKNLEEYEKRKAEVMERTSMNEAQFEKEYGKKPKEYTSAKELDNARQREYAENIDKTGLMYAGTRIVAETMLKNKAFRKAHLGLQEEAAGELASGQELRQATDEEIHNLAKGLKIMAGSAGMGLAVGAATGGIGTIPGAIAGLGKSITLSDAEKAAKHHLERAAEKAEEALEKTRKIKDKEKALDDLVEVVDKEYKEVGLWNEEKEKAIRDNDQIVDKERAIKYAKEEADRVRNMSFDDYLAYKIAEIDVKQEGEKETLKALGKQSRIAREKLEDLKANPRLKPDGSIDTDYRDELSAAESRVRDLDTQTILAKVNYTANMAKEKNRYTRVQGAEETKSRYATGLGSLAKSIEESFSHKAEEVSHGTSGGGHSAPATAHSTPAPAAKPQDNSHGTPPKH